MKILKILLKEELKPVNERLDKVDTRLNQIEYKLGANWDQTAKLTEEGVEMKGILMSHTKILKKILS